MSGNKLTELGHINNVKLLADEFSEILIEDALGLFSSGAIPTREHDPNSKDLAKAIITACIYRNSEAFAPPNDELKHEVVNLINT